MAILGTKKFWKPAKGATPSQRENQILKNSGYINLQLVAVNYMSVGNFWQNTFGGKDNIVLATTLKYQSGVNSVEATSIQDVRKVKVNRNYNLGLNRNIAVRIPANADGISIEVKMTAVKNDLLQAKFDMLDKPEYRSVLELAPTVVGQIQTVTSLVKGLFTDSNPNTQLEASYAGIISSSPENNPVRSGRLTKGLLIMVSTNDGKQFNQVNEAKFELRGDALYYDNEQVENTYIIFNISFDELKGNDENSNWFKKYNVALNKLDEIYTAVDQDEVSKIYNDSLSLWIQGNALIDVDNTYINSEKIKIKGAAIKTIREKYKKLTRQVQEPHVASTPEIFKGLLTGSSIDVIETALPATGRLIKNFKLKPYESTGSVSVASFQENEVEFSDALEKDVNEYLLQLEGSNLGFNLKLE